MTTGRLIKLFIFIICFLSSSTIYLVIRFLTKYYLEAIKMKEFALNITGTFVIKTNLDGIILNANDSFFSYTNYRKIEIINKIKFENILTNNSLLIYRSLIAKVLTENFGESKVSLLTKDNKYIDVNLSIKLYSTNKSIYYMIVCSDISKEYLQIKNENDFKMLFKELADYEKIIEKNFDYNTTAITKNKFLEDRQKFIIESLNIGLVDIFYKTNKCDLSTRMLSILNINRQISIDELRMVFKEKMSIEDLQRFYMCFEYAAKHKSKTLKTMLKINNVSRINIYELHVSLNYDENNNLEFLQAIVKDVTNFQLFKDKLETLIKRDSLTNLYNKSYIENNVNSFIKLNANVFSALIVIDVDDFKSINDLFGHNFGDKIICKIADKVLEVTDFPNSIVSRFSGDEISVFITEYGEYININEYLFTLLDVINSINYDELEISYNITVSIGVSIAPKHGQNFETLLRYADIAMNEAKATGKNKFVIFDEEHQKSFLRKILIEKNLEKSIRDNKHLFLVYQPQFEVQTGKLIGFESLVRWNCKTLGPVSPASFVPIAEKTRLMVPLGKWIFKQACLMLKKIQDTNRFDVKISVNVSPIQLLDKLFVGFIKETIEQTKIYTPMLEIEITETTLMENFDVNIKLLNEIRELGIKISLDDFGTGYSSLTYLKMIPVSNVKIDKSFIDNISNSRMDEKITQKVVELVHILELKTIAEGVETKEQLNYMKAMGCDIIQGYFNGGMPVCSKEIFKILNNNLYTNKNCELFD